MTTPVRRGNGLLADDYLRVARPRPEVADAALDALRRIRIAAFVTPAGDDSDRLELWVDARELDDVATVLASVRRHAGHEADALSLVGVESVLVDLAGGTLDPTGLDLVDVDPTDLDPGPGAADDLGTRNPTPSARPYPSPVRPHLLAGFDQPAGPPLGKRRSADPSPDGGSDLDDAGGDLDDDPDEHFRPDEPESLRTLSRTTVWALAILTVGVVALALSGLAPGLIGAYAPLLSLLGTAAVLVGVGMLVTRLRDGRRDDGEGNDGGPNGDGAVL